MPVIVTPKAYVESNINNYYNYTGTKETLEALINEKGAGATGEYDIPAILGTYLGARNDGMAFSKGYSGSGSIKIRCKGTTPPTYVEVSWSSGGGRRRTKRAKRTKRSKRTRCAKRTKRSKRTRRAKRRA
jgi:hypothetical protein